MPSYNLDPSSDDKHSWTTFPTAGQTGWSNVNKAVRFPSIPGTASGIRDTTQGDSDRFLLAGQPTLAVNEVVINATLFVYGTAGATTGVIIFTLMDGANSNGALASSQVNPGQSGWSAVTYVGSLTQAQLNGLKAQVQQYYSTEFVSVNEVFVNVQTYYRSLAVDTKRKQRANPFLRR